MKKLILILLLTFSITAVKAQSLAERIDSAEAYIDTNIINNTTRSITPYKLNLAYHKILSALEFIDSIGIGNIYDATVDFSVNTDPNTGGTTFNPNTPQLTTKIYVSTVNGSQWTWNGSAYVTYIQTGWGIFGNVVTDAHFVGPTNAKPLRLRAGNVELGQISGDGNNRVAFGSGAMASGNNSMAYGNTVTASGQYSFATGWSTQATGYGAASTFGVGTVANGFGTMAIGQFNDNSASANQFSFNTANKAFVVGIGTGTGAGRADGFSLLYSGKARLHKYGIGTFTGTAATYPAFDANGNIIESATPYGGGNTSYSGKTANYTVLSTDYTIDCTANTFTVTLPTAVGHNRVYNIKNSGTGVITIATTSSQTIDGSTTQVLSVQYSSLTVQSTGSNYIIL